MLKVVILDGDGKGQKVRIEDNCLLVASPSYPPLIPQKTKIFRQYMTDDGLSTGTFDMQTASAKEFWVPASGTADRYITQVSFVIEDATAVLNKFGAITALSNGCEFYYYREGEKVIIHDALKTNWDFLRMCIAGSPAFGTGNAVYKLSNVVANVEAFAPLFDFTKVMPPYGIKLDMATSQKLVLSVRDDTTGVDGFNAICYGFDRFE